MKPMSLREKTRAWIFVRTDHQVPAAPASGAMVVGTGARVVPTVFESLRAQRRRRWWGLAVCVFLPTLLSSVYFWGIASDRYVSDTQMVLSDQGGAVPGLAAAADGKASLLAMVGMATGGASQTTEAAIVAGYLGSIDAMQALDRAIGLRRIWGAGSIDLLSRLPSDASTEAFYRYYQHHVTIDAEPMDPVIKVTAEAFRPTDAQLIVQTLVKLAQQKLNVAFLQVHEDSLSFARAELDRAEHQLGQVNDQLRRFRNTHAEIDPKAGAQAVGTITGGLFAQLTAAEADLRATLSYARPGSPQVRALQARIAALKEQIAADRRLLAGSSDKKPYADLLASYESLMLEQKFAQDSYTAAMAFLNKSRADLMHQQTYLVDFLPPTLPQDATEPRSGRDVLLVFIASLLICLTGSLIAAALREHAAY
jgi:capsular polysaccharide transport system permease protein